MDTIEQFGPEHVVETPKAKTIKSVPSKPGTLGYESVVWIEDWYLNTEHGEWGKEDTAELIAHILEWAEENGKTTVYPASHVAYYRSVLKSNGRISY